VLHDELCHFRHRGVAAGGISVYIPLQNQSTLQVINCQTLAFVSSLAVLFTCGTLTCFDFEIGMTSLKFIPPPNEIPGYKCMLSDWHTGPVCIGSCLHGIAR